MLSLPSCVTHCASVSNLRMRFDYATEDQFYFHTPPTWLAPLCSYWDFSSGFIASPRSMFLFVLHFLSFPIRYSPTPPHYCISVSEPSCSCLPSWRPCRLPRFLVKFLPQPLLPANAWFNQFLQSFAMFYYGFHCNFLISPHPHWIVSMAVVWA